MPRIAPLEAPFAPPLQATLDRLTPPGLEPIALFRTLAQSPRVFERLLAGSLLDPGPLSIRQREIIILRTCALNRCEYEWGVHVAVFGASAGFVASELAATVSGARDLWPDAERTLLDACDDLHRDTRFQDTTWAALRANFDDAQVLELISLCGYYRTISLHANALALSPEAFAPRFPS